MEYEAPLTESQTLWLTILPIPTSMLSIMGSSAIIFMIFRAKQVREWTPYKRLLLGMSIGDILLSITAAIGTFMRPRETSYRVGASGNDATCTASGFFGQLSLSAILYNGMLSFYFLLSARFGWKNQRISRWVEPFMHFICIGFPLVTATIGAVLKVYSEPTVGLGCQINDYPRNCGEGPGKSGEVCLSILIAWIFMGIPRILTGTAIILNNLVICVFVWKQARPVRPKISRADSKLPNQTFIMEDLTSSCRISEHQESNRGLSRNPSISSNSSTIADHANTAKMQEDQLRRLQLVRSQAFLFVGSYFLCNFWVGLLNFLESISPTDEDEHAMIQSSYWILVLYAIFMPMQGLFNMLVYIRPKYRKYRMHFPDESRIWALWLTFTGDDNIRLRVNRKKKFHECLPELRKDTEVNGGATICVEENPQQDEEKPQSGFANTPLTRHLHSQSLWGKEYPQKSLHEDVTSSQLDQNGTCDNQQILQEQTLQDQIQPARRLRSSNLGVNTISELSELTASKAFNKLEDRWEACPKVYSSAFPMTLCVPQRLQSLAEEIVEVTPEKPSDVNLPTQPCRLSNTLVDSPIACPKRRMSPPPHHVTDLS